MQFRVGDWIRVRCSQWPTDRVEDRFDAEIHVRIEQVDGNLPTSTVWVSSHYSGVHLVPTIGTEDEVFLHRSMQSYRMMTVAALEACRVE